MSDQGREEGPAALSRRTEEDPAGQGRPAQRLLRELERQNAALRQRQAELEASCNLYRRLYERVPVACCTLGADNSIRQANLAASRLLGAGGAELLGEPFRRFVLPPEHERFHAHLRQLQDGEERDGCELQMCTRAGAPFWGSLRALAERDGSGEGHFQIAFSDISAAKQAVEMLGSQKDFFHQIAEHLSDFIAVLDLQGRRLYNSPSYRQFFGTPQRLPNPDSFSDIHPEDRERVKRVFRETVRSGHGHQVEYRFVRADGSVRDMASQGDVIRDSEGRIVRVLVVARDITERKRLEAQVHQMAFHDALTGLPNRRLLNDRLNQALTASARSACYGALLFLDMDNFKPLNDAHGHEVGDLLLIEAAQRLRACVREMDTVARFGGDEFIVMVAPLDLERTASVFFARAIADKLRAALAQTYHLRLGPPPQPVVVVEHRCTVSIGVSLFGGQDAHAAGVLTRADMAMYRAKEGGGNQVCFAEADERAGGGLI